jgi:hypothetical protein
VEFYEDVTTNAWFRYLNYTNGDVYRDNGSKIGFCCLRDYIAFGPTL